VPTVDAYWATEPFLRGLLLSENRARLSAEVQARYASAEAGADDSVSWMEVTDALQRTLLRDAGVQPADEAAALRALRAAPHTFPALASIPLYHRFQRARAGTLAPGDAAPDVQLLTLEGDATTLLTATRAMRRVGRVGASTLLPLIVCAGSIS
jgi:hypothetical protein